MTPAQRDHQARAARPGGTPASQLPDGGQGPGIRAAASAAQDGGPGGAEHGAAGRHVAWLREQGATYRAIAATAGLGPMTVHGVGTGRRAATPGTAAALLAVTSDCLDCGRVDAGGARLRLRALHVMGHGSARIARAAGVSDKTIRQLTRGDAATISPRLRDAVTAVYEAWWDKRAPQRTRAERSAAAAARRRAIAGNWCAGAGLDDDQLDTPGYRPAHGWKPATGTGAATDYRLRGREEDKETEA